MARPGRPERNRAARSFRQLRRFHHAINSNKVFGTHSPQPTSRRAQWHVGILSIPSLCSNFGTWCQCETKQTSDSLRQDGTTSRHYPLAECPPCADCVEKLKI